ncbi:MAG: VWA domain-containing protein [Pyrinomonadaceae bacterium]
MVVNSKSLAAGLSKTCAVLYAAALCGFAAAAQQPCISDARVAELKRQIESGSPQQADAALREEIVAIRSALTQRSLQRASAGGSRDRALGSTPDPKVDKLLDTAPQRVCEMLNSEAGWPTRELVGDDGASAFIGLVRNFLPVTLQQALAPVVSVGVERGSIARDGELAALIDRLRVAAGRPQIFGTQAEPRDGFLVLYPLVSDSRVDAWRRDHGLPPLAEYIRQLQRTFRMPVIRSRSAQADRPAAQTQQLPSAAAGSGLLPAGGIDGEGDVVRIESSLVSVDVTVAGPVSAELAREDFRIYEDGVEQEITSFGAADAPFDIVLLLDLSGSTADQLGLIKKTTRRFIEMKRAVDRVAIVTFTGRQTVVSPLESDRKKLLDSLDKIKDSGSSRVWDAMNFAIELLERGSTTGRRKALVAMTDGADNSLLYEPGFGSDILFADLVEAVRHSSVAIFPIYLDTEGPGELSTRVYGDARRTLRLLADESGGTYHTAKNLGQLRQVYERVLGDVGRTYSLVYQPTNPRRDGTWRTITVELPARPGLRVRARRGYYAK